jgi:UPF0755 protein
MTGRLLLKIFITLIVSGGIALSVWLKYGVLERTVIVTNDSIDIEIPKNSKLFQISEILRNKGFDVSDFQFRITSRWYGLDSKIRYGKFRISPTGRLTAKELIHILSSGGILTSDVTIPEGLRAREIAGILKNSLGLDSALFIERISSPDVLARYNIQGSTMEGYLYPETYNFNSEDDIDMVIDKLYNTGMNKWKNIEDKLKKSSYSLHEILTLASIIQGEVMDYSEIGHISAVYNNRLKKGMLLQADPTVQYLFEKPKRLLHADIGMDNPYNTYMYKGLPPGPINNPSIKAVTAALEPSDETYLYMVAKGDGTHAFNNDLEGHLEDKAKLDKLRRKIRREKRVNQ